MFLVDFFLNVKIDKSEIISYNIHILNKIVIFQQEWKNLYI